MNDKDGHRHQWQPKSLASFHFLVFREPLVTESPLMVEAV
jgi:hypothetical protein